MSDPLLVEETCISLEKNRKEIEAGLLILASRSDEQRRRLDDSNSTEHPVTTFQLGSDMLNILDCFCDKTNPGNDGCSKKALSFGEAVAKSLTEKTTEIGENPAEFLLKVRKRDVNIQACLLYLLLTVDISFQGRKCAQETHTSLEEVRYRQP